MMYSFSTAILRLAVHQPELGAYLNARSACVYARGTGPPCGRLESFERRRAVPFLGMEQRVVASLRRAARVVRLDGARRKAGTRRLGTMVSRANIGRGASDPHSRIRRSLFGIHNGSGRI